MTFFVAAALAQEAPAPEEAPPPLLAEPQVLEFVEAPYPEEARAAGLEGSVLLAIELDAAGVVVNATVERAAGHGFDEAAVEAVREMRFTPAVDETGPIPVIIEFEYGFTLAKPAPVAAEEKPVNLDGQLREMGTRRPLDSFVVRVEPEGLEAVSDAEGRWSVRGVPAGPHTVRVVRDGWDPVEQPIEVVDGERTSVKLWVRNRSYKDLGIVGIYTPETADVSRRTISMEEVRRIPGTFGDPVRVIQNLPGAARSPFGTGLLIIRGADPEDSGVYVDGIRIPYIYHLGGFESVLNPDLVDAVDYLPGGFGARYGRSTGGVVDVRTKAEFPERRHVTWSSDLLDTGAMIAGTFGKNDHHGFGVAARRSYIDAILPLFIADTGFVVKPRWYDYQVKYRLQDGTPGELSVLLFGFQDKLTASSPAGFAQGTDPDSQGDLGTTYSTHRMLLTWERPVSDAWRLRFVPSFGNDFASLVIGDSWRLDQSQWIAEVRAEAIWEPNEHLKVIPGVDFVGGVAGFEVRIPFNPEQFAETDPLAEREPYLVKDSQTGWGPDTYVLAEWRPLADREQLLIAPGFRLDYVSIPGEFDFWAPDPRLAARWRMLPRTWMKGSVGLYHQPPQPFQSYRADERPVLLGPERALSASLGWEQEIGKAIRAEVEVFYKNLDQIIVSNPDFADIETDQFFTNDGIGRAYGLEVLLRHEPVGKLFGWISYTLSRSERRDQPGWDWYPYDFDQTHNLVALAGYRLPFEFEVSAKVQYTTGNPTTPYALGVYDIDQDYYQGFQSSAYNSERLPPYWSASMRIDKLLTFKLWQLELYVDLLNLVHGVNPEFVVYNYDYTESAYIKGLPFIPSPGFEAKFEF